ncbi:MULTISPECIES: type II toxin-antitoxin system RelE/ParE family toxin [Francisella]|uniref:Type II toxin-antitoxin system RelE/ParE family toxin n=2 Tax=Francisella philomiragia TaxID=28110 RepID=A0ABS1GEM1_9GAMM|nr:MULTISPECIES: type II toxin-antitoxin system RelE/ParE family toxin [Francisella]AJI47152.1 hypothetical protein BF30_88 [Francisella philomiragia]AJI48996.1 hypothetical protein KU46_1463 [Francisella philomiragia]AJJ48185.1 hypothetical protein CH70_1236 [Francisella tularensis subsp. novicida]KFJ66847.1 hypothetical protein DR83_1188 [Francisella tularensis subsp. novicida]MBK2020053.1 type II toxin-antitoxin system RelE/ParE family toxin [Francisella philomiragia]
MKWEINFYSEDVENDILSLPPKLQAKMLRLFELVELHGAQLGKPHTDSLGKGLFELRAKAQEGIARSIYCYMKGKKVIILHVFIKKTQKTPKKDLDIAEQRMRELI